MCIQRISYSGGHGRRLPLPHIEESRQKSITERMLNLCVVFLRQNHKDVHIHGNIHVQRNTKDQKLVCSHYRPCVVESVDGKLPCVIYCHTNSGSRRDAEEIVFSLLPYGCTVFALDFSGSGLSEGSWVSLGAHEVDDLEVAVSYLREQGSTSTIGLWGRSMGAVTALLYSHRDPSVAGVVADSPFSKLVDLMFEIASNKEHGMSIPKPLVKLAMGLMRRSVRKRADFSIDDVSPCDVMPETFVPTLFGHGKEDTFIGLHHSEKLFLAHGADSKNFVAFEGDHNSPRPEYWYENGLTFLLSVLTVEGPDLSTGAPTLSDRKDSIDSQSSQWLTPQHRETNAPWDARVVHDSSPFVAGGEDEEEMLQRVLALSLEEDAQQTDAEQAAIDAAVRASLQELQQGEDNTN